MELNKAIMLKNEQLCHCLMLFTLLMIMTIINFNHINTFCPVCLSLICLSNIDPSFSDVTLSGKLWRVSEQGWRRMFAFVLNTLAHSTISIQLNFFFITFSSLFPAGSSICIISPSMHITIASTDSTAHWRCSHHGCSYK
jgi:hypothetical protein